MIKHEGEHWILYSKDGSKVLGRFASKVDAEAHEKRVQMFKHMKEQQEKGTTIQTLLFDTEKFTAAQAKTWAKEHGYKSDDVDEPETGTSLRLRQRDPGDFAPKGLKAGGAFRTITLDTGIQAVVGRLKEAEHQKTYRRMRTSVQRMREVLAANPGGEGPALLSELDRDLSTLSEHYYQGFTAMADGGLNFEAVMAYAEEALRTYHKMMMHGMGTDGMPISPNSMGMGYDCNGIRLVATFPEYLIYEHYGRLYQTDYLLEGTSVVVGEAHDEVTAEFVPIAMPMEEGRALHEARSAVLWEERPPAFLREAQLDRAARVIHNTVLVTADSVNGEHGRRRYTDKALRTIAQMGEGLPAFANHPPKDQAFLPRDVEDLIGRHRNVRFEASTHRVVSDLHILEPKATWVFALAEDMADVVGNSLVSRGIVRMEGDTEVVDEIVAVRSGDLVSAPGATRGLFEHREAWQTHQALSGPSQGGTDMKLTDIQDYLKTDPAARTALREDLAGAELKQVTAERDVAQVELKKTQGELTEAKAKNDSYATVEKAREKAARLEKALAESDLAKKYGKLPQAISGAFRELLQEADEARWPKLIEDRVKVLDGVAATAKPGPQSTFKVITEGMPEGVPEGTHQRLYEALV